LSNKLSYIHTYLLTYLLNSAGERFHVAACGVAFLELVLYSLISYSTHLRSTSIIVVVSSEMGWGTSSSRTPHWRIQGEAIPHHGFREVPAPRSPGCKRNC